MGIGLRYYWKQRKLRCRSRTGVSALQPFLAFTETDGIQFSRKLYLRVHAALDRNQFIMLTSTNLNEDHVHHQSAQAPRSRHIPHGNIILQSHFPTFVCRCSQSIPFIACFNFLLPFPSYPLPIFTKQIDSVVFNKSFR